MEHFDWGLPVAIDLFAAGMGAAAFLVAVMADLAGSKKFTSIRLTGAIIAPWPALLGVLFLIVDLGRPFRFWEMLFKRQVGYGAIPSVAPPYLMFNPGSAMSWGTWILTLFVIIALIYLIISIVAFIAIMVHKSVFSRIMAEFLTQKIQNKMSSLKVTAPNLTSTFDSNSSSSPR